MAPRANPGRDFLELMTSWWGKCWGAWSFPASAAQPRNLNLTELYSETLPLSNNASDTQICIFHVNKSHKQIKTMNWLHLYSSSYWLLLQIEINTKYDSTMINS